MRSKFRSIFIGACSLYLFIACTGAKDSGPAANGSLDPAEFSGQPGDCKQFIASLPSDYFHDWVNVQEDPSDAKSPNIHIFYYGKISQSKNVIAFFNGGPGSSSHGNHRAFESEMSQRHLQGQYSFVYLDQRGTGCSSPYPQGTDADSVLRLRWYGSAGIVYDAEAVRKKLLGDKSKWKIFGQSYGAFIVHRYVTLFPESIDRAYAHANVINADGLERLTARIYSQYRVLNLYLEKYPEDKARLQKMGTLFKAQVCAGTACGYEIYTSMIAMLGFSYRWPTLHDWIEKFSTGDAVSAAELENYRKLYLGPGAPGFGLASIVIGIFDRNIAFPNSENCQKVYAQIFEKGLTSDDLLMNECMGAMQSLHPSTRQDYVKRALRNQQDVLTMQDFQRGIKSLSPKTFYLYSGEKDCFVPKESFGEELSAVGNLINYTHFMNSGHEGFRTEAKVWEDLAL
jgi:pimeloyl-ACP methyl ester carboxylesterase